MYILFNIVYILNHYHVCLIIEMLEICIQNSFTKWSRINEILCRAKYQKKSKNIKKEVQSPLEEKLLSKLI